MQNHRIYKLAFAKLYPLYIAKVEKKGRTQAELDQIIRWLTGYTAKGQEAQIKKLTDLETFFAQALRLNPARKSITRLICGLRVEEMEPSLMQEIRYLDKLIDELARGKKMDSILRA